MTETACPRPTPRPGPHRKPPAIGGDGQRLRGNILAYIDAHLDDPALGPNLLAGTFGVSRTWLYRIFAGTGGVKRCIRDKRLNAAFRDLCVAPQRRIIDIAYYCGFSNERQFQRAFRKRFGTTASTVRRRGTGGQGAAGSRPGG